ncbi:hypothetical protein [Hymenobacter sp. 102]|uniref:hypothetical protein n=1 Tax=Hymenobacter sp. 102 TaxID=3403152 RepID=UPI003CF04933
MLSIPLVARYLVHTRWIWPGLPLILILLGRLNALTAGGALAFPDEDRHLQSVKAVEALLDGQVRQACLHLADTQGRPADALLRLPVAALQVAGQHWAQLPAESPASLLLVQLQNWLVLALNMLLFWHLARRWLPVATADTALVVYSALASTQLYLRHLLPYDMALGITLAALVLVSAPAITHRRPGWAGFIAGGLGTLAFTVYPGYYFAPLLPTALLLFRPARQWMAAAGRGLLGSGLILLPLEALTRIGHISYLRSLQNLSGTINQGDFAEGFSFALRYLWEVEGIIGLGLLLLALGGLVALFQRPYPPIARVVALVPMGAWLLHASLAYWGHQFVFYGRTVHFFIPFLVLTAATAVQALPVRWRRVVAAAGSALALLTLVRFGSIFCALAYPRDVLAAYRVAPAHPQRHTNEAGVLHALDYTPPPLPWLSSTGPGRAAPDSLLLINFTFLYPLLRPVCQPVAPPPAGARLLYTAPHFLTLPAYGFEGFTPDKRAQLLRCRFQCRLYQLSR